MTKAQKIEQFVRDSMDKYFLSYGEFFIEVSDDNIDEVYELPMGDGDTLYMDLIEKAATVLGTSVDAIVNMDEQELGRWFEKYSFFKHRKNFESAYYRTFLSEDFEEKYLLSKIFDMEFSERQLLRFDYEDVKNRLLSSIKEIDKSAPGTNHIGATITNLKIDTFNFCHYSAMEEMMKSYFSMFERGKELFFKALEQDLSDDEAHEYNIIVSTIGIRDIVCVGNGNLYYDMVCKCREVYKKENLSSFFDYVNINQNKSFKPWRGAEFVENRELVQKYIEILPEGKRMMREYAMKVAAFECCFVWSDAKPVSFSEEDEALIDGALDIMGCKPIPYEERAREKTVIFVEKTPKELNGDEEYAAKLKVLSGAAKLGGVEVPKRVCGPIFDLPRMSARISCMGGNHHA